MGIPYYVVVVLNVIVLSSAAGQAMAITGDRLLMTDQIPDYIFFSNANSQQQQQQRQTDDSKMKPKKWNKYWNWERQRTTMRLEKTTNGTGASEYCHDSMARLRFRPFAAKTQRHNMVNYEFIFYGRCAPPECVQRTRRVLNTNLICDGNK